jgi:hypothetical protein
MKILEGISLENRVLYCILLACAAEYALNYVNNAPFTFDHLVKYAIAYPIYGMYVHRGKIDSKFENHNERISSFEEVAKEFVRISQAVQNFDAVKMKVDNLDKTYHQLHSEVKILLKILPKLLSKANREQFETEIKNYHQEIYKEHE